MSESSRKLEMDNAAPLNIGRLSIEIPADCPDRPVFESVVRDELQSRFGDDAGRAALAKSEFDRCMEVPKPFVQNADAASHYQSAQLALSPPAHKWQMFKDGLRARFLEHHPDDGSAQEPEIPGWQPPWEIRIAVRSIARAQEMERPGRDQTDGRSQGGGGRER
jgi:hypothetical protein